jgi:hypothetical protein
MNTRRPIRLATSCLLAGALGLGLAAQADPQQPGGPPRRSDHGGGGGGPGFGPGGGFGRGSGFEPGSEEYQKFREQLKAFCLQHSPRRWQEVEDRIQRPNYRGGFMRLMGYKFRELLDLEKKDPALHAIKVRLIEVEDVEYGLTNDLKNADKNDTKKVDEIRGQLREQNEKYVRLRFEERSHRIDRLAKLLEDEKRKLADDRDGSQRLVDERLAELEKQGPDFFFVQRYTRRDGDAPSTAPAATAPAATPAAPDK